MKFHDIHFCKVVMVKASIHCLLTSRCESFLLKMYSTLSARFSLAKVKFSRIICIIYRCLYRRHHALHSQRGLTESLVVKRH